MDEEKFIVPEHQRRLSSWEAIARREIIRWLNDEAFRNKVTSETLSKAENPPGPFTRFLYHFAWMCDGVGWGVMIDFSERTQQVYLCDKYYKWMHKLCDEITEQRN